MTTLKMERGKEENEGQRNEEKERLAVCKVSIKLVIIIISNQMLAQMAASSYSGLYNSRPPQRGPARM